MIGVVVPASKRFLQGDAAVCEVSDRSSSPGRATGDGSHDCGCGSWAAYSTDHQLTRKGQLVSVWLRQEYAEPQQGSGAQPYLSTVENVQYDCAKNRVRALVVIYYTENNIRGGEDSEQSDPKEAPWSPIVPGTLAELNFQWACAANAKAGK